MITTTLHVALGGALGAALRFHLALALARPGFPIGILGVNVLGSLLMGGVMVWLGRSGLDQWQPLVMAGFLGGFTTFSAFSLEAYTLWDRGLAGQALLYVALSVGLSILGLAAGVALARNLA